MRCLAVAAFVAFECATIVVAQGACDSGNPIFCVIRRSEQKVVSREYKYPGDQPNPSQQTDNKTVEETRRELPRGSGTEAVSKAIALNQLETGDARASTRKFLVLDLGEFRPNRRSPAAVSAEPSSAPSPSDYEIENEPRPIKPLSSGRG